MENWTEIIIAVDAQSIDTASDIANMTVPYGIFIEDYRELEKEVMEIARIDLIDEELLKKDRSKGLIHIYIEPDSNPKEAVSFLKERFGSAEISCEISLESVHEDDWANNWKKFFKPLEIGQKLAICPEWEHYDNKENRAVLRIDPGMAFGTGTHETTRLCMLLLEKYIKPGDNMLDVGSGSGILSIASILLGAESATGVDIDSVAVRTSLENSRLNKVDGKFTAIAGNLVDKVNGTFDIIAANIVADVILLLLGDIGAFLKNGGALILSGIIDTREQDILNALAALDFEVLDVLREKGWTAVAVRAAGDQPCLKK